MTRLFPVPPSHGSWRGLLAALLVLAGGCHQDVTSGRQFQCGGPLDPSCGPGCACVPAPEGRAFLFWCDCTVSGRDEGIAADDEDEADSRENAPEFDDEGDGGDEGNPVDVPAKGDDACVPDCVGKACGDDGCGGSCGSCAAGSCSGKLWYRPAACVLGTCQDAGTQDCDDHLACTSDTCDPVSGCSRKILPESCLIDGACLVSGQADETDACRLCRPSQDVEHWTVASDGTTCVPGSCSGLSWTRPRTCVSGLCNAGGGTFDCNDQVSCTDDSCTAEGCRNALRSQYCLIPGQGCFVSNEENPGNPCELCDLAKDSGAWTVAVAGTECLAASCNGLTRTKPVTCSAAGLCNGGGGTESCDDHLACTADACTESACTHTPQAGTCAINGQCYAEEATNGSNVCQVCSPSQSAFQWTRLTDGTSCGAGCVCYAGGTCKPNCTGRVCGDDGCGGSCGSCPESSCGGLVWTVPKCVSGSCSGQATDCNDHLACTTDACSAGSGCSNTLQGGYCLIGKQCVAEGQTSAADPCLVCRPEDATDDWAWTADGTPCGSGGVCRKGSCCQPSCAGKVCGDDGCGGSRCGSCAAGQHCGGGKCLSGSCPDGFVLVPAGQFSMGSPDEEPGRSVDESLHTVKISRGFCLKATEVSVDEWNDVMGGSPSVHGADAIAFISWSEAIAYCNMRSQKEGLVACYDGSWTPVPGCRGYRLPTEAEWEYAARAGTSSSTYNGTLQQGQLACEQPNAILDPIAWFCGNAGSAVHPVGTRQANAWGLYDMLGNLREWCQDWKESYPTSGVTDPTGPGSGTYRVVRGGNFFYAARFARAAARAGNLPGTQDQYTGFRPARSLDP